MVCDLEKETLKWAREMFDELRFKEIFEKMKPKRELVNVRVNFMCEQDGTPIRMNMGFSLPRSPYVINGIAVDEDTLLGKIHSVQKQYGWSKVWFTLDDMGKIDWSRICNVEVIDNE